MKEPLSLNLYTYCEGNPIIYLDSSGNSATLIGAILGAVVGGASNLIQGKDVISGVVSGAVSGALVGLVIDSGGTVLAIATTGALAGGLGDYMNQVGNNIADGKSLRSALLKVDLGSIIRSSIVGGVSGAITGVAGVALKKFTDQTTVVVNKMFSKGIDSGIDVMLNSMNSGVQAICTSTIRIKATDISLSVVFNVAQNALLYYIDGKIVEKKILDNEMKLSIINN